MLSRQKWKTSIPLDFHALVCFLPPSSSPNCEDVASAKALPGVQEDAEASAKALPGTQGLSGASDQMLEEGAQLDTLSCFSFTPTSPMVGNQSVRGSPCPPRSFFRGDQETNHLCPSVSSTVISVRVVVSIERLSF